MEPRSNIEKPKDRKVKRQKNQKIEDMEIIEIKKDQQQYISEIAALESDIFPDPWSEKSRSLHRLSAAPSTTSERWRL